MLSTQEQTTVNQAIDIISSHYKREDLTANSAELTKQYCQLEVGHLEHEVFGILYLDTKHQLIKFDKLFRGTINYTSVYPREVVKEALNCNAAAVIVTHNHPSGNVEPSEADKSITQKLMIALGYFDIKLLDHVIVSEIDTLSFVEQGLI